MDDTNQASTFTEQVHDADASQAGFQPAAAAVDHNADLHHAPDNPAPDPQTAAGRLRAFEDEHFGVDAVRIDGMVERGSGSPFAAMSDKDKHHYAMLEKLVIAEQALEASASAVAQAEADHAAAVAAVEKAESDAAASE